MNAWAKPLEGPPMPADSILIAVCLVLAVVVLVLLMRGMRGPDGGRLADLERRVADHAASLEEERLRASRLEAQGEHLDRRCGELGAERDGLIDALHRERREVARLESDLTAARLAADKDLAAERREVTRLLEMREQMNDAVARLTDERDALTQTLQQERQIGRAHV